jgi:hypothetical protein
MNKVKILLTLLTIAITVTPIVVEVLIYRDNLLGLIIPPEITDLINGDNNSSNSIGNNNVVDRLLNSRFDLPKPVGDPNSIQARTLSATFSITNPLQTPISIDKVSSGIISHNDGFFIGNLTIDEPIRLEPGQTADIPTTTLLSDGALNYLKDKAENQDSINIDLIDLNVDLAGIQVQLDKQNIGDISIPPQISG